MGSEQICAVLPLLDISFLIKNIFVTFLVHKISVMAYKAQLQLLRQWQMARRQGDEDFN